MTSTLTREITSLGGRERERSLYSYFFRSGDFSPFQQFHIIKVKLEAIIQKAVIDTMNKVCLIYSTISVITCGSVSDEYH